MLSLSLRLADSLADRESVIRSLHVVTVSLLLSYQLSMCLFSHVFGSRLKNPFLVNSVFSKPVVTAGPWRCQDIPHSLSHWVKFSQASHLIQCVKVNMRHYKAVQESTWKTQLKPFNWSWFGGIKISSFTTSFLSKLMEYILWGKFTIVPTCNNFKAKCFLYNGNHFWFKHTVIVWLYINTLPKRLQYKM